MVEPNCLVRVGWRCGDPAALLGQLSCSRQAQGGSAHMSQVTPDSQGSRNAGGAGPGARGESRPCPGVPGPGCSRTSSQDTRAESRALQRPHRGQGPSRGHSLGHRPSHLACGRGIPSEDKRATEKGGTPHSGPGAAGEAVPPAVLKSASRSGPCLGGREPGGPQRLRAEEDGVSRVRVGSSVL